MIATILATISWFYRLYYYAFTFFARYTGLYTLLRYLSKNADFILATRAPVGADGAQRPENGAVSKHLSDIHRFFKAFTSLEGVSNVRFLCLCVLKSTVGCCG